MNFYLIFLFFVSGNVMFFGDGKEVVMFKLLNYGKKVVEYKWFIFFYDEGDWVVLVLVSIWVVGSWF